MSNERRTYEGHELFKLENFEEGQPYEDTEGIMFFFRDFLFESIYHTIDSWYHNFKKKVARLDQKDYKKRYDEKIESIQEVFRGGGEEWEELKELLAEMGNEVHAEDPPNRRGKGGILIMATSGLVERRRPYRQEIYKVHMGERQFDDFKITFRRCEDEEEIEIKVMYGSCESIFTDINVAVGFIIHCIGISHRKHNDKLREEDAKFWDYAQEAVEATRPKPQFTVTDKPCGEMWNPTSHCIIRTGENVCVSCQKEVEKENEADVSRPDAGGASPDGNSVCRGTGPENHECREQNSESDTEPGKVQGEDETRPSLPSSTEG